MSTELAKKPASLKELLGGELFREQVAMSLPAHLDETRFVRIAQTALSRVPKLGDCTQTSFFKCLLDLSAMGLEPDGRRAHLIPYGKECTLIIDYKGLVELVRRSGEVSDIHADVICENDDFSYQYGSNSHLTHKPALGGRGKAVGAYSFVSLKDGSESFEVMDVEEVERVRACSKAKNNGPWVTHWNEMAKKTVFRRHTKWLPMSVDLRERIEKDDDQYEFNAKPKQVRQTSLELPAMEPETEVEPEIDKSDETDLFESAIEGTGLVKELCDDLLKCRAASGVEKKRAEFMAKTSDPDVYDAIHVLCDERAKELG